MTSSPEIDQYIPPLYRKARLSLLPESLQNIIAEWNEIGGLFFWGPPGSGKTHVAFCIARQFLILDKPVKRNTFRELSLLVRSTYSSNSSELSAIRFHLESPLTIIDDIGVRNTESDHGRETLLHIIDHRIEQQLPTILTSNLNPEQIEKLYGQRIGSRLKTYTVIQMSGNDKRGNND